MPIYEYKCLTCGSRFESLQKMGENKATCPECGAAAEKVMASSFSVAVTSGNANQAKLADCDRSSPCCGRSEPCSVRPCQE